MKGLISWFVRNPIAANLLMVAMVFGGVMGYFTLEREFIPQPDVNGMSVSVSWPGASPQDVEEQIIVRVEEAIDGLDGIDYIESEAYEGGGNVNISTELRVDYERMVDEIKARVDTIRNLPPDAFRPEVRRWKVDATGFFLALHADVPRLELQREATKLRRELTQIDGFQLTRQNSKISEQVTIEVSEDQLRRYDLTFSDVSNAISQTSVNQSAGTIETTGGNLQLRTRNLADTEAEFGEIIVRQTQDGAVVRVRDIATVIDGFDDSKFAAQFKGQNAAIFSVNTPETSDVSKAGRSIREFEEAVQERLPDGYNFTIWSDGSEVFDSRMSLIGGNAIQGMFLVLIVLMLFLRPKVAIWVTIGIGAAFMGAIAVAPYVGITLNMISLFAFLLVIGIVVDDAIVVGESVHFHVENGVTGERGAIAGANMVAKPVFFAVITTIMMFFPFLLLSGPIQAMFAQISLVVIFVLLFSLVEAFFILPAHLRHLEHTAPTNPLLKLQDKLANTLVTFARERFRPIVATLIRFRYATFATFVGMMFMAITLLAKGIAPTAALPEVEGDMIQFSASFPEGTTFERKEQVRLQLEAGIAELNANAKTDFGLDDAPIARPGTINQGRRIEGYLALTEPDLRPDVSTKDIADKLEEYVGPIPDSYRVNYGTTEGSFGGNGGGMRYAVTSADPDALRAAVLALKTEMESYAQVPRAWDTLESSANELNFVMKPGAETLGITLADVTRQVREAFYGREVQRLPRNGEDVRVMVRYPEAARESLDSLQSLRIRNAQGVEVPIYSVADVTYGEGVGFIRRRDRKRVEYTGARVRGEQEEVAKVKSDLEENFLPQWELDHPDVERLVVGDDDTMATLKSELTRSMIVILFMMYALLAIAFKSWAQPLLIMIAIPFALVGMIFGNFVTDIPFGIMSVFGFFAASGVAVNDNLVLIDYVNRLRAQGVGAYQAMLDACVARFRPILLTSLTTFIGITPILFETSIQAEFLKPMVVALAFGVLFDFFLTLMLVPAMYGIGVDITRFFRGLWRGEKQPGFGSTYDPEMALALDDLELADDVPPARGDELGGSSLQPAE